MNKEIEQMTKEIEYAMNVTQKTCGLTVSPEALAGFLYRKGYRKEENVIKEICLNPYLVKYFVKEQAEKDAIRFLEVFNEAFNRVLQDKGMTEQEYYDWYCSKLFEEE